MDAVTRVPEHAAEPVRDYAPGSPERAALERRLDELAAERPPLPMVIGGERRFGGGERLEVVQPHHHAARLGEYGNATREDAGLAVDAALAAGAQWRATAYDDRAAVLLRAAELLAGPWRETVVAAAVLGESRSARQAELAVCGLVDGWRRAVREAKELLAEQPASAPGEWRRADHRPLDGFVYVAAPASPEAVTAPVLLGNTVVWRPRPAGLLAAHHLMRLLEAAGLPPGVVNLVTGDGQQLAPALLADPALAGVYSGEGHHPGGRARAVAEPAGRGFLVAHRSADPAVLRSVLIRGAFGEQSLGRAYLPRGLWQQVKDGLAAEVDALPVGDVTDLTNFMGALPDRQAYRRTTAALERAVEIAAGGQYDEAIGWFVRPTVLVGADDAPGPVLAVQVYEDWAEQLGRVAAAPCGSVLAREGQAITGAVERLRYAAARLQVNGLPARPGAELRPWIDTRTVAETLLPSTGHTYPHMR
ncbi:aldehyde dehydrogenase family protein [Kitasatospora sp. NPDC002227]|uniref:aldehyde dehydrogenase family protein n=1 Tax=Kitasatospora sp. NPDC002227 TaxID=3154773 RepID=UPI003317B6D8